MTVNNYYWYNYAVCEQYTCIFFVHHTIFLLPTIHFLITQPYSLFTGFWFNIHLWFDAFYFYAAVLKFVCLLFGLLIVHY